MDKEMSTKPPLDLNNVKVGFVTLTIGFWDLQGPHWDAIIDTYNYPNDYYLVLNNRKRWSLSAAINKGFKRAISEGCDYIVYISDDVIVAPGDVESLLNHLYDNDLWVCLTHSTTSSGYFFFAADPVVFEKVGWWDEEFYPAYFEDNDFDYRIRLLDPSKVGDCAVNANHLGSETVRRMTPRELNVHHEQFVNNRERYKAKWGGEPHQETYTIPWNGGEKPPWRHIIPMNPPA